MKAFLVGLVSVIAAVQEQKLTASDAAASNYFGESVAVSGDTTVVGALNGKAYVLTRSGTTWSEQGQLTPGVAADGFGSAVALSGDTALVGARDFNGTTSGTAFPFVRAATTWTPQGQLTPSDGAPGDAFGAVVSLSQDTALVGAQGKDDAGSASGAAYVFVRSGTAWSQQKKLTADDAAGGDAFGVSVAVDGDTAVVGASGSNGGIGAAYVFVRAGTAWTQQKKLTPTVGKHFGASVAVSGDTVLVGEPTDAGVATGGSSAPGTAFVFTRIGTVWAQQSILQAGVAGAYFGASVALDGNLALVGASGDTAGKGGLDVGAAYAFRRVGTSWSQEAMLTATGGAIGDQLSRTMSLRGGTAILGAPKAGGALFHAGAAYVYRLTVGNGSTCEGVSDCPSGFCVDGICCDTACGGGAKDDCEACSTAAGAAKNGTCGPAVAGTQCRAAGGSCNVAESCDGTATTCPADAPAPDGTACGFLSICVAGACKGSSDTASGGPVASGADGGAPSGAGGAPAASPTMTAPSGIGGDDGGSGCRAIPRATSPAGWLVTLGVAIAALALRRRRKS